MAIVFTTKVEVKGVSPEQIRDFFLSLNDESYRRWHPRDHKSFFLIKKTPEIRGSEFFFDENIGGFRIRGKWIIRSYEKHSLISETRRLFLKAILIVSAEKIPSGTLVTHTVKYEILIPFLGRLIESFLHIIGGRLINMISKHAQEEFKNLENILIK